jgi:hypothetical protein
MSHPRTRLIIALTLILAASLSIPLANAEPGERDGRRRGPPQEAFDACVGLVEADACSFSGDHGDAEGTCIVPPRGEETLVCAPSDGGPRLERRRDRESDSDAS